MKNITLLSLLLVPISLHCAEQSSFQYRPVEKYPAAFGYIAHEDVLTTIEQLPDEINKRLISTKLQIINLLNRLPQDDTPLTGKITSHDNANSYEYMIYIAGARSRECNKASSLGYDPYQTAKFPPSCSRADLAAQYRGPIIHHITRPIIQKLIEKSGSKMVKPLKSWIYKINSEELDDRNYIAVEKLVTGRYTRLDMLTESAKKECLQNIDLEEFYRVLAYTQYAFPEEANIYIDQDNNEIMLPNAISPDNEGLGTQARFGKSVLGQDLWKAKHNIRVGHEVFGSIIQKYGNSEDSAKWNNLLASDPNLNS